MCSNNDVFTAIGYGLPEGWWLYRVVSSTIYNRHAFLIRN